MEMLKRTKLVCTIGPASGSPEMFEELVKAGLNVARLNFSHGKHEAHAGMIAMIRSVSEKLGEPVAILQDLQGPKVRCGDLPEEGIQLEPGATVVFTTEDAPALPKIGLTHKGMHTDVKAGDRLLIDDGLLDVLVKSVEGRDIVCEVVTGGKLTSHKGINLPTATLSIPAITEKDKEDLRFGVEQRVDFVALSFVREAREIRELRELIKAREAELGEAWQQMPPIRIVAKIEKHEAIRNIDEIIAEVDAIMIARGDLGIETPPEHVPVVQKTIIAKCLAAAKPVIVATQMMDSMIRNPRPTRAEVSDVANAVMDHTDAIMLSGESATGKYPLETVQMMTKIAADTERSLWDDLASEASAKHDFNTAEAVTETAVVLARDVGAKAILVASSTGNAGRLTSRYRPELPIFVGVHHERVMRQMSLSWGVRPFVLPEVASNDALIEAGMRTVRMSGLVRTGDRIVVVTGAVIGKTGGTNRAEVRIIEE
jgi:pyruvate kinase